MGEITFALTTFYFACLVVFFVFYLEKLKDWKISLLFASMTTFVAREYYEIPIFVAGYLGVANQHFPMFFHHLLVLMVFIFLIVLTNFRFTLPRIILLILTPIAISPLLLISGPDWLGVLYFTRVIGVSVFGGVFINGCSLVR